MEEDTDKDADKPVNSDADGTASFYRRKYPWAMLVVVLLFVVVPFISWYGTWFGRPLSDSQISEYLNDNAKARHIQQALGQIVDRLNKNDASAKQWYSKIASLDDHPVPLVRETAAWTMQYDPSYDDFHTALRQMLSDSDPGARHQAALSLVAFHDAAGRNEIVSMLKPYSVRADSAGKVTMLVKEGDAFSAGSPIARIQPTGGQSVEEKVPQAGRVELLTAASGHSVDSGEELAVLSPSIDQVWEALRALYLVGEPEDIAAIQHYTLDLPGMPDRVRQQAASAMEAIRGRAQGSGAR
jgi:hypothetical protein